MLVNDNMTYKRAILNIVFALFNLVFFVYILPKLILYFMPFAIGGIIALIANPAVAFIEKRHKIKRRWGSAIVILSAISLVILVVYLLLILISYQVREISSELPKLIDSLRSDITITMYRWQEILNRYMGRYIPEIDMEAFKWTPLVGNIVGGVGEDTANVVRRFAKNIPFVIISIVVALISAYLFIAKRDSIITGLSKIMSPTMHKQVTLIRRVISVTMWGVIKAQFKIEAVVYIILVAGLAILRIKYSYIIALGIAMLDILPIFGTGAILWPWAILKLSVGDIYTALGLMVTWGVGQLVRQVIQPKIVGDTVGMPAMPTLVLIFIGYRMNGFIGMIIAIPIGMIVLHMYQGGVFDITIQSIKMLWSWVEEQRSDSSK